MQVLPRVLDAPCPKVILSDRIEKFPDQDALFLRGSFHGFAAELLGNRTGLALDFDETACMDNHWLHVQALLPSDLRRRANEERKRFGAMVGVHHPDFRKILDEDWLHHSTHPDARAIEEYEWVRRFAQLMNEACVSRSAMHGVGDRLPMRAGTLELRSFFERCVVISVGMEPCIASAVKMWDLHASVAANRFVFDDNDIVHGTTGTPVVGGTKIAALRMFSLCSEVPLSRFVVIGDSYYDAAMMIPETLNILLIPRGKDPRNQDSAAHRDTHLTDMLPKLNAILYADSFLPLVEALNAFLHPKHA